MVIVWWWSGGGGRQDSGRADEQRAEVSGARLVREAGGDSRTGGCWMRTWSNIHRISCSSECDIPQEKLLQDFISIGTKKCFRGSKRPHATKWEIQQKGFNLWTFPKIQAKIFGKNINWKSRSKNKSNKANEAWPIQLKNHSHFKYQERVTQSKSNL